MTTTAKKIIACAVLVVAAAIAGVYWYMSGGDGCTQLIPKDAIAVGKLDLKKFVLDNDINTDKVMDMFGVNEEDVQTGIDLTKPVYAFVLQDQSFGVVATVDDEEKLEAFVKSTRETEIESQRGMKWAQLETRSMMVSDGKYVMVMNGAAADQLRNRMAEFMKQDKEASIAGTNIVDELKDANASLALLVNGANVPAELQEQTKGMLPKNAIALKDMHAAITLHVKENKLSLGYKMLPQTDSAKEYFASMDKALPSIDGEYIAKGQSHPVLWACCGVDGQKLLEMMRKIPTLREYMVMLGMSFDLDMMIKAVDGDVAVGLIGENWATKPEVLLQAKMDNTDFLKNVKDWQESVGSSQVSFNQLADGSYLANTRGADVYFGKGDKKTFYLASDKSLKGLVDADATTGLEPLKKEIKESHTYITIDLDQAMEMVKQASKGDVVTLIFTSFTQYVAQMDRLTYRSTSSSESELTLSLKEGNNIVESLLSLGASLKSFVSNIK